MAAAKHNLVIEQGATFVRSAQLSSGGPVTEGGTPISLVGAEVRMMIRRNYRAEDPYFSLSSTGGVQNATGIYVDNAAQGQFTVTIHADDTEAITWGSGVYDLEVEFAGGMVRRYLYGTVKVTKEVTHD